MGKPDYFVHNGKQRNNYLYVKAGGLESNRDRIGAKITVGVGDFQQKLMVRMESEIIATFSLD